MSYDLAVWHASRPITTQEASDIYRRLGEEELSAVGPHQGANAFLAELTTQYPQIDDWDESDIDNCPWSGAFDQSDRYLLIYISFSRVAEIMPLIEGLAAKHDLVCFNPQWPCVMYPPRIAAMPHLRLSLENRTLIDNPTPDQIANALSTLQPEKRGHSTFRAVADARENAASTPSQAAERSASPILHRQTDGPARSPDAMRSPPFRFAAG